MTSEVSRRKVLKGSLAAAGLSMIGLPEWAFPALAQGETLVPFTDIPEDFKTERNETSRIIDMRTMEVPYTPANHFFTTQHYGHPQVDPASFRLRISGLVDRPAELSIDEVKAMGSDELVFGFECSGNSRRIMQGLASNGRWTGVPLKKLLESAGVKSNGKEVVFFGADSGPEEVEFRGRKYDVEQQYGRSISLEKAMSGEPMVAYALNGAPLTVHQGFPLRLLMPGWYGAPNVKWLANIHVQEDPYLGKFQARWYRTLRAEMVGGKEVWKETAITRMRVKSVVARVTKKGSDHNVFGFVLGDGTPLKSVEVKIDGGPWQAATVDASLGKYSWKLFNYTWKGATPGEHTIVSRATDVNGVVQPEEKDLEKKLTFLEDNSQFPRTVMVG